jgi:hypothetical protein
MPGYKDSNFTRPLEVFDYVMNLNARRFVATCIPSSLYFEPIAHNRRRIEIGKAQIILKFSTVCLFQFGRTDPGSDSSFEEN